MLQAESLIIERSYLTEIILSDTGAPTAGKQFKFKDYPQLTRGVQGYHLVMVGVDAYVADTLIKSPSGNTVVSLTDASKLVLTIQNTASKEVVYQIPVTTLIAPYNAGRIRKLNNLKVNLTKSAVTVLDTLSANNLAVCFNWYYKFVKVK